VKVFLELYDAISKLHRARGLSRAYIYIHISKSTKIAKAKMHIQIRCGLNINGIGFCHTYHCLATTFYWVQQNKVKKYQNGFQHSAILEENIVQRYSTPALAKLI
jgi:hypothetical protein